MKLPAISLHRPWSIWIARGWKTIETRLHPSFESLAGKDVAIHSALAWDDEWTKAARYLSPEQIQLTEAWEAVVKANAGRAELVAVVRVAAHRMLTDAHSRAALIDCGSTIRYGLILENLRPLAPRIPWTGKQGVFTVEV
jgi:hypothetical protein